MREWESQGRGGGEGGGTRGMTEKNLGEKKEIDDGNVLNGVVC